MQQPANRVKTALEGVKAEHDDLVKLFGGNSKKAERRRLTEYRKVYRQFRRTKDQNEKDALRHLKDRIRDMEKGLYTRGQRLWRRSGRIIADTFRLADGGVRWLYRKITPMVGKAISKPSKKASAIQSHQDIVNDLQAPAKGKTELSASDPLVLKRRAGKRIVIRAGKGNAQNIG